MRATSVDRRLEAIAGTPTLSVRQPWNQFLGSPLPGTLVAVGKYVHDPAVLSPGQALLHIRDDDLGVKDTYLYRQEDRELWNGGGRQPAGQGDLANGVRYAYATLGGSRSAGIGRHQLAPSYGWRGPIAGAIYDRVLTDAEALAVALSLSLSLSLSLRLTPTPHPHTPATSRIGAWQHEGRTHRPAHPVACGDSHPIRIQYRDANVRWPGLGVADDCTASRARHVPRAMPRTILPVLHRTGARRPHMGRVVREFERVNRGPRRDRDSQPALALRLHVQRERGHAALDRAHRLSGGVS